MGVLPIQRTGTRRDDRLNKSLVQALVDWDDLLAETFKHLVESCPDGSDLEVEGFPPWQEAALTILQNRKVPRLGVRNPDLISSSSPRSRTSRHVESLCTCTGAGHGALELLNSVYRSVHVLGDVPVHEPHLLAEDLVDGADFLFAR